jgi:hypothetical protein
MVIAKQKAWNTEMQKTSRIVLHVLCGIRDRHWLWHWQGIHREINEAGTSLLPESPSSPLAAIPMVPGRERNGDGPILNS